MNEEDLACILIGYVIGIITGYIVRDKKYKEIDKED